MFKYSKVNGEEESEALLGGYSFMEKLVNEIGIFAYSFLILFLFGSNIKNCELIQQYYASSNNGEQIKYLFYIRDHIGGSIRPFSEKLSRFEKDMGCIRNDKTYGLRMKINCLLEKVENDRICLTNKNIKNFFEDKKQEILDSFHEDNLLKIKFTNSNIITNHDLPLLAKVNTLDLSNSSKLTDVSALGNVKHLYLTDCVNVTSGFSELSKAVTLYLSRTGVTDKHIKYFKKVKELSLTGCKGITDISEILKLPNLGKLWIGGTKITLDRLKKYKSEYDYDGEYIFNAINIKGKPVKIYFTD